MLAQAVDKIGGAILVTHSMGVNHRLGVYGHLDLSAYGPEWAESANVWMIDIVDALKWVRENISKFGGDPDNVTLFGQSGGGAKVIAMMASREADGLFRRGIIQSGATDEMGRHFTQKRISQAVGAAILKRLGIKPSEPSKLKDVPEDKLVNAAFEGQRDVAVEHRIPISIGKGYASEWEPVVDGLFLTKDPVSKDGFVKGAERYGMLIGSNLTEWNTIMPKDLRHNDTRQLRKLYAKAFPDQDPAGAPDFDALLRLPIREITAARADLGGEKVYSYVLTRSQGSTGVRTAPRSPTSSGTRRRRLDVPHDGGSLGLVRPHRRAFCQGHSAVGALHQEVRGGHDPRPPQLSGPSPRRGASALPRA